VGAATAIGAERPGCGMRAGLLAALATAVGFEVVTLIFFSHSASSEAEILDTVEDEAEKLRLRP
jgi:hypothetical protein